MRGTGCNIDVGADNAVRPQHADGEIRDMHGAALALAVTAFAPEQLAHHLVGISALGQGVAVTAMGREQIVIAPQVGADPSSDRLLTDRGMNGTKHQLFLVGLQGRSLKGAYAVHQLVMVGVPRDIDIACRRGGVR